MHHPSSVSTSSARRFARLRDLVRPQKATSKASRSRPTPLFDPARCTGCGLCASACAEQHGVSRLALERDNEAGSNFVFMCQHCLDPLCLAACPHGAISRGDDGIVRMNKTLCVNCGLCLEACPEAAPRQLADGTVIKCDACEGDPRCAKACPNQALTYTAGKTLHWISPLRWAAQSLSFLLLVVVLVGSVCSLNIATLDLACPFGVLQNVFSSKVIVLTTLMSGLLLVGFSVLFGRAFCGWVCPFGFILDLVDKVLPRTCRLPLPGFLKSRINKYGVAAGGLAAAGVVGTQAFCLVCPIGTVCRSYGLQNVMISAELAVVPAIAALDAGGKRSWCRYLCPVGAVFALAAKVGLVRIEIGATRCKKFSCMRCAEVCPMGIIPESSLVQGVSPRIEMSECITCLRCVDSCPHNAASVRFVWQKPRVVVGELPSCERCESPATTNDKQAAPATEGGAA